MATNWAKIGKWAAILTPIAVVGGYFYIKSQKDKSLKSGEVQKVPKKVEDVPTTNKNTFPLKKGVKDNEYVGKLQYELDVVVDNWFGQKTEDALYETTGKKQIDSLLDLTAALKTIQEYWDYYANEDAQPIKSARAKELVSGIAKTGNYSNIKITNDTTWKQVDKDAVSGTYSETGKIINWKSGQKLSLNDYELTLELANGNVLITVSKAGLANGLWSVNPLHINLI